MATPDTLRYTKIPLTHGSGAMPAVGFGTLIHDPLATDQRNEDAVGDAMQAAFRAGTIRREDVFVSHEAMEHQSSSRAGQARL